MTIILRGRFKTVAILIAISIIGLVLRVADLGSKSYWGDEILSIKHAGAITDLKSFLSPVPPDAHPPLYFLILKGWSFFGSGEVFLRLLSVIFGVLSISATYFLGRQFFNKRASLFASSLMSLSPLFLLYDREVRMYSLFTLLSILSLLFFIKALKEDKEIYWAIYTLLTVFNTYTHYHAFLIIISQWLFFLMTLSKHKNQWKRFIISQVIIASLFLFWFPSFLFHAKQNIGIGKFVRFPITGGFFIKPLYLFFCFCIGQTILPWNYWLVIPAGLLFLGFSLSGFLAVYRNKEEFLFFLSMLLFPIIIANIFSELMPRYLIFLAPIYYVILGQGFEKIAKPVYKIFCLTLILFILGYGIRNYYANKEFHIMAQVDPWREAGSFLKENVSRSDIVFNIGGVPINYYTGFNIPILGADTMEILKKEITGSPGKRFWLILSNPEYKGQGEEAIKWMNEHYSMISEKRYFKDPDYARKGKLFRKEFLEYRIRVYLYQ
jgi:uncharacterized membrane protein